MLYLKKIGYKTVHRYYWRYVGDIFASLTSPEHLKAFQNLLYGQYANTLFAIENGKQSRMPFFDIEIICEDKTFTTSVYRKPTF